MGTIQRTPEQIKEHYLLEKQLASRLKNSSKEERKSLYNTVYNELFSSISHHPQFFRRTQEQSLGLIQFIRRLGIDNRAIIEIGAGDCRLSIALCAFAKCVCALDVSPQVFEGKCRPDNFEFKLIDGIEIPIEIDSIDFIISNQLLEHLHPEDALDQLVNLSKTLKDGGKYLCITPSKIAGPHDVSKYFDKTPTGFHLSEYDSAELKDLFSRAGFKKFYVVFFSKGIMCQIPVNFVILLERLLSSLPEKIRRMAANRFPFNKMLGNFLAIK